MESKNQDMLNKVHDRFTDILMFDNNIEMYSDLILGPSGDNISILKTQFSFNEAQSD